MGNTNINIKLNPNNTLLLHMSCPPISGVSSSLIYSSLHIDSISPDGQRIVDGKLKIKVSNECAKFISALIDPSMSNNHALKLKLIGHEATTAILGLQCSVDNENTYVRADYTEITLFIRNSESQKDVLKTIMGTQDRPDRKVLATRRS